MKNELLLALLASLDEQATIDQILKQLPQIAKKLKNQTNLQVKIKLNETDLKQIEKQLQELRKTIGGGLSIGSVQAAEQAGGPAGQAKRQEEEQRRMSETLKQKEILLNAIEEKYQGLSYTTTQYIQNAETGYHAIAGQITHTNGVIEKFNVSIKEGTDEGPLFGIERIYENIGKVVKDTSTQLSQYGKVIKENASKQMSHLPIEERLLNIKQQAQKADNETAQSIQRLQEAYQQGVISVDSFVEKQKELTDQNERFQQVAQQTAQHMQQGDIYKTAEESLKRYKEGLKKLHQLMDKKSSGAMSEQEALHIDNRIKKLAEELDIYVAQTDQVKEIRQQRLAFAKDQTQGRREKNVTKQMREEQVLMKELTGLYVQKANAVQRAHQAKRQGKTDTEAKELALIQQQEQRIREINNLFDQQPRKIYGSEEALRLVNEQGQRKLETAQKINAEYDRMGDRDFRSRYGESVQQTVAGQETNRMFEKGQFDSGNTKRIQEYVQQLHQGEIQIKNVTQASGGLQNATHKLVVTTDHHKNRLRDITYTYNEQTGLLHKTGEAYRLNANRMLSWTDQINIAIKRMAQWAVAGTLIYGTLRKIREGIGYVSQLDKELTQVAIIQQISRKDIQGLAQDYGELGMAMSKTVEEISRVNTELIRQGLSIQEAGARMETILKLSSTGMISTDESLKIITTAVNAMQEGHEKAADVILRASQVSAASVEQLGESFTKTASSAFAAGVNIEQTSAILSAMTEVTQEGPSQLGTSLKTILARFNAVNEETGTMNLELNKVQKAIESVGVEFTDASGQIRNVYSILEDLSGVWQDLDKNTQAYIATTAAGVRMQNRFYAIMNNFNIVNRIHNELLDSSGTLTEGYATYLNSVEASSKRARVALENLWNTTINSDAIIFVNDLVTGFTQLVERIGALELGLTLVNLALLKSTKIVKSLLAAESFGAMAKIFQSLAAPAVAGVANAGVAAGTTSLMGLDAVEAPLKGIAKTGTEATAAVGGLGLALGKLAVIVGAAVAITFVTKKIFELATASRRAREDAMALSTEYMLFQRNLPTLTNELGTTIDRLKQIDNQVRSHYGGDIYTAPLDLQREYSQLRNEIGSLVPEYIEQFSSLDDALASGYDNILGHVEDRAEAMRQEVLASFESLIDDLNKEFGRTVLLEDIFKRESEESTRETERILEERRQELLGHYQQLESMGTLDEHILNFDDFLAQDKIYQDYLAQVEKFTEDYDHVWATFQENLKETQNYISALLQGEEWFKDLSRSNKRLMEQSARYMMANAENFFSKEDFEQGADEFFDGLLKTFESKASEIENFQMKIDDLIELESIGKIDRFELEKAVSEIMAQIFALFEEMAGETLPESFKELISQIVLGASNIPAFVEGFNLINHSLKDMYESGKKAGDGFQLILQAQEELNEQGFITSDLMLSLLDEYADMEELLGKNTEEQLRLLEAKKELHAIDNHHIILGLQRELEALNVLIEGYEKAVKTATSFAQIRMYEQLIADTSTDMSALEDRMNSFVQGTQSATRTAARAAGSTFRAEYDRYLKIETIQRNINHEIEKRNLVIANSVTEEEKYLEVLEEKIGLLRIEQDLIHQRAQESRKERSELESFLSRQGFIFEGEGDKRMIANLNAITGKSQEVLDAYNRYIQLQTQDIPALGRQWMQHQNEMISLAKERHQKEIEMIKKQFEIRSEYIDKEIEQLQKSQEQALEYLESLISGFNLDSFKNQIRDISQTLRLLGGGSRVSSVLNQVDSQISNDLGRISNLQSQINTLVTNQLNSYIKIEQSAKEQFSEFDEVKNVIDEITQIIQQKISLQEQLIKQEQRLQNQISQRRRQHEQIESAMQREIERYQEWNESIVSPSFDMRQFQDAIAGIGIEFDLPVNLESLDSSEIDADLQEIYQRIINYNNQIEGDLDSQLRLKQELLDLSLEIQDSIRDTNLKYQLQRKLIEEGIAAIEKAEKIRFDNINKQLDHELKKYNQIIDARMKMLDEESAAESYEEQLLEQQQKTADLRTSIDKLALDDSHGARTEYLQKIEQLEAEERNLAKMQNDRTRDLRKQNLQNQKDYITEYIDMLKQRNQDLNILNLEQIDFMNFELEELERVYAEQVATLQLFAEQVNNISADLNKGINDNLEEKRKQLERERELNRLEIEAMQLQLNAVSELKQHLIQTIHASQQAQQKLWEREKQRLEEEKQQAVNLVEERMEAIIQSIINGTYRVAEAVQKFNEQVAQLGAALTKLNNLSSRYTNTSSNNTELSYDEPIITSSPIETSPPPPAEFLPGEEKASGAFIGGVWYTEEQLDRMFGLSSGGYTGSFSGGKLAMLHEKELVLNQMDTKNLMSAVELLRDSFSAKIPQFTPAITNTNSSVDRSLVFNFHIDKMTGNEKDTNNLVNKIVRSIQKIGG